MLKKPLTITAFLVLLVGSIYSQLSEEGISAEIHSDNNLNLSFVNESTFGDCPSSDLTNDCVVDFDDLVVFAAFWLDPDSGNGIINFVDFAILSKQWAMDGRPYCSAESTISLSAGLNLVSLPIVGCNNSLPELLESIHGNYEGVFVLDPDEEGMGWSSYSPHRPLFLNNLTAIDKTRAFWINMSQADQLLVKGISDATVFYTISAGWNYISYPSLESQDVNIVFQEVSDSIIRLYAEDGSVYIPRDPVGSTLDTLEPRCGYLLLSSQEDLWVFQDGIYGKQLADLRVCYVLSDPMLPELYYAQSTTQVDLEIAVNNIGRRLANTSGVDVKIIDNYEDAQSILSSTKFGQIGPGEIIKRTLSFDLSGGIHNLSIQVDPNDVIQEESETNNAYNLSLEILNALDITINRITSPGEVPVRMDFDSSVTGGQSPYTYFWIKGTEAPSEFSYEPNASFVYSEAQTHLVELRVVDNRGAAWSDTIEFTLLENSNTENPDFGIEILDLRYVEGSNSEIEIQYEVTENNGINGAVVRVELYILDLNDPNISEVIYDDVIIAWGYHSEIFTITTGDLPNGDYQISARINYRNAVTEQNMDNNQDSGLFSITDSDILPRITIDAISLSPETPIVDGRLQIDIDMTNNGPADESVMCELYYENVDGIRDSIKERFINLDRNGGTGKAKMYWTAPRQPGTTLFIDVTKFGGDHRLLASASRPINITPYEFELVNFQIDPRGTDESPITTITPVKLSAIVKNLSPVPGNIAYRIYAGGFALSDVVFEGQLLGMQPGEEREVSHIYTAPAYQNYHPFAFELITLEEDLPLDIRKMFDWDLSNNYITIQAKVYKGTDCGFKNLKYPSNVPFAEVYADSPYAPSLNAVYSEESHISFSVFNGEPSQGPALYPLSVDVNYIHWNTGQPITDNLLNTTVVNIESELRDYSVSWIPSQVGPHTLTITGADTTFVDTIIVQPKVTIGSPVHTAFSYRDAYDYNGYVQTDWSGDGEFDFKRLKLWTQSILSQAGTDSDTSSITGRVSCDMKLEDETGGHREYIVDIRAQLGYFGLVSTFENASLPGTSAGADYDIHGTIGISDRSFTKPVLCFSGNEDGIVPCRTTLFKAPSQGDLYEDIAFEAVSALLSAKSEGFSDFPVFFLDFCECEKVYAKNFGLTRPLLFSNMRLKSNATYELYQQLEATVSTYVVNLGSAGAIIDFYNRKPHTCDDFGNMLPIRGIWIEEVKIHAQFSDQ